MIRLFAGLAFVAVILTTQCAQAQERSKTENALSDYLGSAHLQGAHMPTVRRVLAAVQKGDWSKLSTWDYSALAWRVHVSTGGQSDAKHPFVKIQDDRTRNFLAFLVEIAYRFHPHPRHCPPQELDLRNAITQSVQRRLGREYDKACVDKKAREDRCASEAHYCWTAAANYCFERNANPAERAQLLSDFAFIMDNLLFGEFANVYSEARCKKTDKPKKK